MHVVHRAGFAQARGQRTHRCRQCICPAGLQASAETSSTGGQSTPTQLQQHKKEGAPSSGTSAQVCVSAPIPPNVGRVARTPRVIGRGARPSRRPGLASSPPASPKRTGELMSPTGPVCAGVHVRPLCTLATSTGMATASDAAATASSTMARGGSPRQRRRRNVDGGGRRRVAAGVGVPRRSLWPMAAATGGSQTDGQTRWRPLWRRGREWRSGRRASGQGEAARRAVTRARRQCRPRGRPPPLYDAVRAARAARRRRRAHRPRPGPAAAKAAAHPAPGAGRAVDAPRAGRRPPIDRRCRGAGAAGRAQQWPPATAAGDRAARRRRPPRRVVGKRQARGSGDVGGGETHAPPRLCQTALPSISWRHTDQRDLRRATGTAPPRKETLQGRDPTRASPPGRPADRTTAALPAKARLVGRPVGWGRRCGTHDEDSDWRG